MINEATATSPKTTYKFSWILVAESTGNHTVGNSNNYHKRFRCLRSLYLQVNIEPTGWRTRPFKCHLEVAKSVVEGSSFLSERKRGQHVHSDTKRKRNIQGNERAGFVVQSEQGKSCKIPNGKDQHAISRVI